MAADDGLLVIDRNSDGLINNGGELSGDSTVLKDGSNAAHGYAALAEFDTNSDGLIDTKDEKFADLKIWRDLNQDGVSQTGELFALTELGIQSLDTAYQNTNTRLGNGNSIAQKGSYTLSDGSKREMGDLLLANDTLHSRYADPVTLTGEQMQAANLQGIGRLRDLREAAALSPKLAEILAAYSKAETKAEQQALVDILVGEWAKTDPRYGGNIVFAAPFIKTANEGVALTPSQANAAMLYLPSKEYQAMEEQTFHKIAALDAFSGEKSNIVYVSSDQDIMRFFHVANKAYDTLSKNIYQALLFQTRLQPYLNEIGLKIENDEFVLDYSGVTAKFGEVYAANPEKAFVDLGEFIAYGKTNEKWVDGISLWIQYLDAARQDLREGWLDAIGSNILNLLNYRGGAEDNDLLTGTGQTELLLGYAGDDKIHGYAGNDMLYGGSGNDTLYGGSGKDTLDGGLGSDRLEGGYQNDTYVFAKGYGEDVIFDSAESFTSGDTIRFTDVDASEVKFRKEGNDLVLFGYGEGDSVRIEKFYQTFHEIENFEFKDKTVTLAEFKQNGMALQGTDGDDVLYGYAGNDILIGGSGGDSLRGGNNSADTYVFTKGHGQDTVSDSGYSDIHIDTLIFEDALLENAVFSREGSNLLIQAYGGEDKVSVQNYFSSSSYRYNQFAFEDATVKVDASMNVSVI